MQINKKTTILVAAVTSLSFASASWAASITLKYDGFVNGGKNGQITKTSPAPTFNNKKVSAGQFNFNVISSPDIAKWDNTLQAFCIDVDHWLKTNGNATYDIISATAPGGGLSNLQLAQVGWLFDHHASDLGNAKNDAAFQLSLWEIFFETNLLLNLNLSNGTFKSDTFENKSGTTKKLANEFLKTITTDDTYRSSGWEFYVLNPDNPLDNQRLITWREKDPGNPPAEVSEPGTLLLLSLGLGAVFFCTRRRNRAYFSSFA